MPDPPFITHHWCSRGCVLPGPLRPLPSTDIRLRDRHEERVGSSRARDKRYAGHRRRIRAAGDYPGVAAAAPDAGPGGNALRGDCVKPRTSLPALG